MSRCETSSRLANVAIARSSGVDTSPEGSCGSRSTHGNTPKINKVRQEYGADGEFLISRRGCWSSSHRAARDMLQRWAGAPAHSTSSRPDYDPSDRQARLRGTLRLKD